jgi:purine-binding chemotaxis protein CheW
VRREHLLVQIGDERYGLPVDRVLEVLRRPTLTPVPGAPSVVLGLHNLRGQALAVLDLAALLDLAAPVPRAYAVVVEDGERQAGLAVDAALDVVGLDGSTDQEAPGDLIVSALHDDAQIGLIDVGAVLDGAVASMP